MTGATVFFLIVLAMAPVLGMLLAYAHCYHQRLQGVSGQKLEGLLIQWGFLTSFALGVLIFWFWPEGAASWTQMPMFKWFCKATLIDPPQADANYQATKAMVSLVVGGLCGLIARLNAFRLTRRLVREVPRYYRAEDSVGKR
ncbi:hypothetical protein JST97_11145 [bacterium]|nr:hypothetical protein [bacterium]